MKKFSPAFLLLLVSLGCVQQKTSISKPSPDPNKLVDCHPAANEKCPTEAWWQEYLRLKAWNDKYKAPIPPQQEQDEMAGLRDRLVREMRTSNPGYDLNESTGKLVLAKPAQPPAK